MKRDPLGIQEFARTTGAERFRGGGLDRAELIRKSIPPQKRFFRLCEQHLDSEDDEVRVLATALFQHCDRLFAFLAHPGVEPTNNSAGRALRHAVIWRKISFGNTSAKGEGEAATARLLTVARTCVMRQRNALKFLCDSISRYRAAQPSLWLLQR